MQIRNSRIIVTLPDEDWQRECSIPSRPSCWRATPEKDARGRVLGEAMHMLRYRAEGRKNIQPPTEEEVVEAALSVMELDSYSDDHYAFRRLVRGRPAPSTARPDKKPTKTFAEYKESARASILAFREWRRDYCRRYGRLPPGWAIDIIGDLPATHASPYSHVSDEAWA